MELPADARPPRTPIVAYFSMEIGFRADIPTYAGGLGVLAGDALRAAADLDLPLVAVTLVHRKGYFRQHLDAAGTQTEEDDAWSPDAVLEPVSLRVAVEISGRTVTVGAWRYAIAGHHDHPVPVYLLDTDLPENAAADRALTDHLYGGDDAYRLRQEAVLGIGGVAMLRALGYAPEDVGSYHLNEGHSALLAVALLRERLHGRSLAESTPTDLQSVHARCVFTTHTPVPAGHDQFPAELVRQVLGDDVVALLEITGCCPGRVLNMTRLALFFSRFVNGVAMRHGEVSRGMFPQYPINSITNGVHAPTWAAPPFQLLFDRHIPEWRRQNLNLRYAIAIPPHEIRMAHDTAKQALIAEVERRTGTRLAPQLMTIGFARRAAVYKRADLLFSDLDRLRHIDHEVGPLQIVYAGKAHPRDEGGKALIRHVFAAAAALSETIPVVYLEDYDMALGQTLCAGVDVWLNTPQRPHEASGTSGMKAALNGVPSLSVLDGWWIEGHVEGVTGWAIGAGWGAGLDPHADAASLYEKLERAVLPMYYGAPDAWDAVARACIALNGSFFNAERMMFQYAENAYAL